MPAIRRELIFLCIVLGIPTISTNIVAKRDHA